MAAERTGRRGRQGGRSAARKPAAEGFRQLPWRNLRNPYPPVEVISADQVEAIHHASLAVLRDIGMDFLLPEARALLKARGASVQAGSERVRFDPDLVLETIATAPAQFTMHGRVPGREVHFGGNNINFGCVSSAPYCSDIAAGRRTGTYRDFNDLVRLTQTCNMVHLNCGYPVEPVDLPPETRHLDCGYSFLTLSDKVWYAYSLGRRRAADGLDLLCLSRGLDRDRIAEAPGLFSVVNTSSPLRVDGPMLEGILELSAHGQPICVTPFTLAGAMSPVTIAGALTQQNAEALAVIAFTQMVRPGAPVIYGGFTSNVDMRSGAPAFGTPEYARAALAGAQLARRYAIPYRSSNANAANIPDAQAAQESMMSLWAAVMGHTNLVLHGAGWMEGGLTASFEKFMLDVETLQMMAEFMTPLAVDEASLALDAIAEVGPGGHFFGAAHTLARYETAFYQPILADWRNYESWAEDGARTALERAHDLYKRLLREFAPPPIDPALDEALRAFVRERKAAIAAAG